jgi:hypothetical protein
VKPFCCGKIKEHIMMEIVSTQQKDIPENFSSEMKKLVKDLLIKDQFLRPNVEKILESTYIQKYLERYESNDLIPFDLHYREELDP